MPDSSFNSSSNSSSNSSVPGIFPTPQSDFSLQLSQYLQSLGQSLVGWAQQEYGRAGQVTDASIQNYLQMANQGAGIAGQTLDRYENTYAPLEDQYAREAQTYASDARIQHDMGRAEAGAKQAQDQAKANSENELESFGIDPSSGRYQDLVQASNTKAAADAAAAGENARITTEAEGQRRKTNAIMMGQQLPGAAVNELNSAYQGIAGAENAALGLANTGANLMHVPDASFGNARNPEQPLFGNTSKGTSGGGSVGGSSGGGSGSNNKAPGNQGGQSGGGPDNFRSSPGNSNPASLGQNAPGYQAHPVTRPGIQQVPDFGGGYPQTSYNPDGGLISPYAMDPWNSPGAQQDPYGWGAVPGSNDPGYLENYPGAMNPGNDYSPFNDNYGQSAGGGMPGWGDYSQPTPTNWPDPGYSDPGYNYDSGMGSGQNLGGWDTGSLDNWNTGSSTADWSGGGGGSYPDTSDYGTGGDFGYAQGGPVGGGKVPAQMSPSGGARVDDVQATIPQTGGKAMLNAGEFVLPRDVVAWKGQEFFQKMIQQARKARTGAPAKPSAKPTGGFNAR